MKSKKICNSLYFALFLALSFSALHGQYSLVGNAAKVNPTTYRLTNDAMWQNGSVWNTSQIDLSKSFDLFFELYFGTHDIDGADGMTFTLQRQGTNAGGPGGGIGASGITPSLIVEYDTYQNADYADPVFDHIAIERDGVADHTLPAFHLAGPVQTSSTVVNVEDGAWHNTRVKWDAPSKTMTVYFDCVLRLTYTDDIVATIFAGNPMVYYGFTAATGGSTNEHSIRGFHFGNMQRIDTAICKGDTIQIDISGDISYDWKPAIEISSTTTPNPFLYPSVSRQYISTVSNCYLSWNDTIDITVNTLPSVDLGNDITLCDNDLDKATLTAKYSGSKLLQWSTLENNVASISISKVGSYWVQITDSNQCSVIDTIEVSPYCNEFVLDWPNVITPNGDGKNDVFKAKNVDDSNYEKMAANIKVISFSVYDRWGLLLFHCEEDTLPHWDGRFNGNPSASGTYYFIIQYSTSAGKNYEVPGYMTLL